MLRQDNVPHQSIQLETLVPRPGRTLPVVTQVEGLFNVGAVLALLTHLAQKLAQGVLLVRRLPQGVIVQDGRFLSLGHRVHQAAADPSQGPLLLLAPLELGLAALVHKKLVLLEFEPRLGRLKCVAELLEVASAVQVRLGSEDVRDGRLVEGAVGRAMLQRRTLVVAQTSLRQLVLRVDHVIEEITVRFLKLTLILRLVDFKEL